MTVYEIDTTRTQDDANALFVVAGDLLRLTASAGFPPEIPDHRTRCDDIVHKIAAFEDARGRYHERVGRALEWASGRMSEIVLDVVAADHVIGPVAPPATTPTSTTSALTTTTTVTR